MRRRLLLVGGSAAVSLAACSPSRGQPAAGPGVAGTPAAAGTLALTGTLRADTGTGPLSAMIEHQGDTYRYDETAGTDLGDYVDPQQRFVQGCVRTTHDQLSLTVFFRRDRGSNRAEVVFELGRLWLKTPPANLGAYRATIIRGDQTLFAIDVPQHYWFSRWRWQSAPRPVIAKVKDLIASGKLPPYDESAGNGTIRPTRPSTYQIMELAGLAKSMSMTGERADIGAVTEQQADFICTGRASALATILAQAEAAGTIPWHFRDENTGAPLDKRRYPHASVYGPHEGDPYIQQADTGMHPDSAHQPAVAYVPFLLTGDPYHLETMQFQETFNLLEGPGRQEGHGSIGQERAYAWVVRTLGQLAIVTPENPPRWLLPRSYYQDIFNIERDWLTHTFLESTEAIRTVFRTIDQTYLSRNDGPLQAHTMISPWQDEFVAFMFAWLVKMGHHDWEPIARWKMGCTIGRTDGKSGWSRAYCTPYRLVLRPHRDSPWAQSWGEAWELNKERLDPNDSDPNRLLAQRPVEMTYPIYTRGALAMGVHLGIAEARPCFEWIDGQIQGYLKRFGGMEYKWAVR